MGRIKRIAEQRPFYASFTLHFVLIVLLGIICYSNTFDASFHIDDYYNIVTNYKITGFDHFAEHPFSMRSVGYLTFALNYRFHGLDITGYHITNLAVHVLNAFLVYSIVALTLSIGGGTGNMIHRRIAALLAGLLFVSHPVQTQAVTYIVQRFASLATLFYLVSLFAYIRSRISRRAALRLMFYALFLASGLLAVKSKENAVSLPIVIVVFEFMFFSGRIGKRARYLLPMLLSATLVPVFFLNISVGDEVGMSGIKYLLTQFRVVVTYIRLLILPVNQSFDYDYPLHDSLIDPPVLLSVLFLSGIFAFGMYLIHKSRSANHGLRFMSFGVFWFFITLLPESTVIPLGDVIVEHRVYLPSVGVFSGVAVALMTFIGGLKRRFRILAMFAVAVLIVVFAGATYSRNRVWKDEITLWTDVVRKSPEKARGYHNLGTAYRDDGQSDRAIEYYRAALKLDPRLYQTHCYLGITYRDMGMWDRAMGHYWAALAIKPDYGEAHLYLGEAYEYKGFLEEAASEYSAALELTPGARDAEEGLARVLEELKIQAP